MGKRVGRTGYRIDSATDGTPPPPTPNVGLCRETPIDDEFLLYNYDDNTRFAIQDTHSDGSIVGIEIQFEIQRLVVNFADLTLLFLSACFFFYLVRSLLCSPSTISSCRGSSSVTFSLYLYHSSLSFSISFFCDFSYLCFALSFFLFCLIGLSLM